MTEPRALSHPQLEAPDRALKQLERILKIEEVGPVLDRAVERAKYFLDKARQEGANLDFLNRLDATYQSLKGQAHQIQREALEVIDRPLSLTSPKREIYATDLNVKTVKEALLSESHWASKDYRANLTRIIEGNQRIPESIKPQLFIDVARVLEIAPHAGGIAKELTLRGQRGVSGGRSKLGNRGNAGIGYAYEFMGTAALSRGISTPLNAGASKLYIQPGVHTVTFGDKISLDRRLMNSDPSLKNGLECDIRIFDPNQIKEVGVDFKHTISKKHSSKSDKRQIEAVVQAISEGQIDEYHFVTNRSFGEGFLQDIADANAVLADRGANLIGCHEYVAELQMQQR